MARHHSRSSLSSRSVWQPHILNKKCAIDTHLLLYAQYVCVCVCSRLSVGDFKCGSRVVLLRFFPIQRVDQQNGSLTRIACFEVLDDFHFGMIIIAYQTHYNIPVVACYMKNDGCFRRRVAAGLNNLIVLLAHDPSLSTGKHISPERVSGIVFSFSEIGQLFDH